MAADHLASDRLVRPFNADLSTPLDFAYFLLVAKDRLNQPKIDAFRTWGMAEALPDLEDA